MSENFILRSVIILIILLLIYLYTTENYNFQGIWIADESFLKEAKLNSLMLYIGECSQNLTDTTYNCYLYADNNIGVIEDQPITITFSPTSKKITTTGTNTWEDSMTLHLCKDRHIITLMSNDTVYAELYKDNILTDYALSA